MRKKINIPFSVDTKDKKKYNLLSDKQIGAKMFQNKNFLDLMKNLMLYKNNNINNNKIEYIKASETKKYYENLKKKNKLS